MLLFKLLCAETTATSCRAVEQIAAPLTTNDPKLRVAKMTGTRSVRITCTALSADVDHAAPALGCVSACLRASAGKHYSRSDE
jgi:hypothetical protein